MSFDLDDDDDGDGSIEIYDLKLRNSEAVWAVLNNIDIDHVVASETNDELEVEFNTAEDYNNVVDLFTQKLGSQAYPEGVWPELIDISSAP